MIAEPPAQDRHVGIVHLARGRGQAWLETDAKRIRFAHILLVDGIERATFECMTLHFDTHGGRTAPLPESVQTALQAACVAEVPDWAGRNISMDKRR